MTDITPAISVLLLTGLRSEIVGHEKWATRANGIAGFRATTRARAAAKKAGMAVMHVRVAFSDADYAAIPATNKTFAALAQSRMITDGSEAAAIHPALAPAADEEVFTKKRVGRNLAPIMGERLNCSARH